MRSVNHPKSHCCSLARASVVALLVALAGCTSLPPESPPTEIPPTETPSVDLGNADLSTPGMVKTCTGCTSDQVCVEGACVDVPMKCPCPKETYCDLATNTCKVGCAVDVDCASGRICNGPTRTCQVGCRKDEACGSGQICDATLCRTGCRKDEACGSGQICAQPANKCVTGCRKDLDCGAGRICDTASSTCTMGCRGDADCTAAGQICDMGSLMCRPGCRSNAGCPNEQICNTATSKCIAGCDADARCNAGRICEASLCVDGCRTSATCALRSYCDSGTKKCTVGCNFDKTRCAIGEACVSKVDGTSKCQTRCAGYDCNGTGWECYREASIADNSSCRQRCTSDGDCSAGMRCTWFTLDARAPSFWGTRYCAQPCTTAGCATCVYSSMYPAGSGMCNTTTKACYVATSTTCYQAIASYGL